MTEEEDLEEETGRVGKGGRSESGRPGTGSTDRVGSRWSSGSKPVAVFWQKLTFGPQNHVTRHPCIADGFVGSMHHLWEARVPHLQCDIQVEAS